MSSEQYLPGMAIKVKAPFYVPLLAEERLVETQVQGVTLVRVDACLCRDEFCLCTHSDEYCLRLGLSLGQEKSTKRNKGLLGKMRSAAGLSEVQHYKLKESVHTLWFLVGCELIHTLGWEIHRKFMGRKKGQKKKERKITCKVKLDCSWMSVFWPFQKFGSKFRVNQLFIWII